MAEAITIPEFNVPVPIGIMSFRDSGGNWTVEAHYADQADALSVHTTLGLPINDAQREVELAAPLIAGIDPRLKPERQWRLFDVLGFQVLVTLLLKGDDEDDRPCVKVESPCNGVMLSIAIRGMSEKGTRTVFEGTTGDRALKSLLDQIAPVIDIIVREEV